MAEHEQETIVVPLRWARASDPDGPGDRVGVTDMLSEGMIYINKPPGFVPVGPPDKVMMVQRGYIQ